MNWSFPDKSSHHGLSENSLWRWRNCLIWVGSLALKGTHLATWPSATANQNPGLTQQEPMGWQSWASPSPDCPRQVWQLHWQMVMWSGGTIWTVVFLCSTTSIRGGAHSGGVPKSASKGGYLSDGDSPELVAKSGKHGNSERKSGKARDPNGNGGSQRLPGTELDIDAFRPYSFSEQPKCLTYISGLMSLHFYGAEDLKPLRADSRDVYCAIQVDSVNKARTALLTCRTAFLDMDHTFNIDLENAQHLKLVVFSWESTPRRNRVCCHGTVALPALFRVRKMHQLAVRLEPRGMMYVKLSLMEQRQNSLDGQKGDKKTQVFGVEARRVVEREASGLMVPLLIEKCISEIERRGCQVSELSRSLWLFNLHAVPN